MSDVLRFVPTLSGHTADPSPPVLSPLPQNTAVWNICDEADNDHEFWGLMRALFGYTCKPTPVEIIAYFLYWALAITFLCFKLHLG